MKKLLSALISGLMVLSLTACGSSTSTAAAATGAASSAGSATTQSFDTIIEATKTASNIDPLNMNQSGKNFLWEVYEMLFDLDGFGGDMYGVLADSSKGEYKGYDHEAGTPEYTVYLYQNIKDSAGNAITASDVVFSYNTMKDSGYAHGWNTLQSVDAVDDYTVKFTFTRELSKVGELSAYWARCFVFSQKAYEASASKFASDAVGTGPYVLKSYTAGSGITLEKNPNYWQTDTTAIHTQHQANIENIQYKFIDEDATNVVGLQTGDVDIVEEVATKSITDFQDGGAYADTYDVYQHANNLTDMALANVSSDSICNDINMRLALFYAIDPVGVVNYMDPNSVKSVYALGNANFPDYDSGWEKEDNYETLSSDARAAKVKEYLDKAGYSGQKIKILCLNEEHYKNLSQVVGSMLNAAGIQTADVQAVDNSTYQTLLADSTDWDLDVCGWAANDFIVNCWDHIFSVGSTGKTGTFIDQNDQLITLLNTARETATHTQENVDAVHEYYISQAYGMGLCQSIVNVVYNSKKITNLVFTDKSMILPGACTYTN